MHLLTNKTNKMTNSTNKPTTIFWVIAVAALLWNIMGVTAYLGDAYMPEEVFITLPDAQQEMYNTRPAWATAAFALGVFGGLLGCIMLLLRKKIAKPLFIISLVSVLVLYLYMFGMNDGLEVLGPNSIYMPIMVTIVCILLVLFANKSIKKGWLS